MSFFSVCFLNFSASFSNLLFTLTALIKLFSQAAFSFFFCLLIESCFCFYILCLTTESAVSISATFVSWTNIFAPAMKVLRSIMSIINHLLSSEISSWSNESLSSRKKVSIGSSCFVSSKASWIFLISASLEASISTLFISDSVLIIFSLSIWSCSSMSTAVSAWGSLYTF